MPQGVRDRLTWSVTPASSYGDGSAPTTRDHVALCVAVYQWKSHPLPAQPVRDWVWWSGYAASAVQLGIAAIPFALYNDWTIFMATAVGTVLAYASASLPQWRQEKWHSRVGHNKPVALTLGNGSEHVIIIEGCDTGYDLEALAGGPRTQSQVPTHTILWTSILAVLWLGLLISCTGIQANTWYLLGVGGLGMLQNIVVAAAPRMPEALGLPIELVTHGEGPDGRADVFVEPKVMWTLMELETKHKGYGRFLRDEFFPGALRQWELEWWESEDAVARARLLGDARRKRREERESKAREAVSVA